MAQIATHPGLVTDVKQGKVIVKMQVLSACSSCAGHEKCAFVDKADKVVEVETADWKQYSIGDGVTVSVNEGLGLYAVLLAYILPALIIVGALMISEVRNVSFGAFDDALPAFLTIIMMPLTSSIANGFAFGFVSYVVMKVGAGKIKEISPIMWIIALAFLVNLELRG